MKTWALDAPRLVEAHGWVVLIAGGLTTCAEDGAKRRPQAQAAKPPLIGVEKLLTRAVRCSDGNGRATESSPNGEMSSEFDLVRDVVSASA